MNVYHLKTEILKEKSSNKGFHAQYHVIRPIIMVLSELNKLYDFVLCPKRHVYIDLVIQKVYIRLFVLVLNSDPRNHKDAFIWINIFQTEIAIEICSHGLIRAIGIVCVCGAS